MTWTNPLFSLENLANHHLTISISPSHINTHEGFFIESLVNSLYPYLQICPSKPDVSRIPPTMLIRGIEKVCRIPSTMLQFQPTNQNKGLNHWDTYYIPRHCDYMHWSIPSKSWMRGFYYMNQWTEYPCMNERLRMRGQIDCGVHEW